MTFVSILLATAIATATAEVPASEGWVTDRAGFLSASERDSLARLMESYWLGSQERIALLTVDALGGKPIESFALEVARAWSTGDGEGSGVLVVVAKEERKIRIETGRDYEGRLPDVLCARIIQDVMVPPFRAGQPAAGIRKGIEAIHAALGGDYAAIENSKNGRKRKGSWIGLFPLLLVIFLFARAVRGARRSGVYDKGGDGGGLLKWMLLGSILDQSNRSYRHPGKSDGGGFGGFGGGSFGGFGGGGGGGFGGGGATGGW